MLLRLRDGGLGVLPAAVTKPVCARKRTLGWTPVAACLQATEATDAAAAAWVLAADNYQITADSMRQYGKASAGLVRVSRLKTVVVQSHNRTKWVEGGGKTGGEEGRHCGILEEEGCEGREGDGGCGRGLWGGGNVKAKRVYAHIDGWMSYAASHADPMPRGDTPT